MVGADLENLVNEAAIIAARHDHDRVHQHDFTEALERIVLGTERRIMLSPEERERTAYHESGHALLGMLLPGADPVRKISIVPRGRALGVTFQAPDSDRYGYGADYLRGRITGALGGPCRRGAGLRGHHDRGGVRPGAGDRASRGAWSAAGGCRTRSARSPCCRGRTTSRCSSRGRASGPSPRTQELVDEEVRRIVDGCYADALRLLTENRERLTALAEALLERETLDEADAYEVAGIPREAPSAR